MAQKYVGINYKRQMFIKYYIVGGWMLIIKCAKNINRSNKKNQKVDVKVGLILIKFHEEKERLEV